MDSNKKSNKKTEDPWQLASFDIFNVRMTIQQVLKRFSEEDKKSPNYQLLIKEIRQQIEFALHQDKSELSQEETEIISKTPPASIWTPFIAKWNAIKSFYVIIKNNPIVLILVSAVIGAIIANPNILKILLSLFKKG